MLQIFISYRRSAANAHAHRLFRALRAKLPKARVFLDEEELELGADFPSGLQHEVLTSSIVLALIDSDWASSIEAARKSRHESWVKTEIGLALRARKIVIPVLIDDADLSKQQPLPPEIRELTNRQGTRISDARWDTGIDKLVDRLQLEIDRSRRFMRSVLVAFVAGCALVAGLWFASTKLFGGEPRVVLLLGSNSVLNFLTDHGVKFDELLDGVRLMAIDSSTKPGMTLMASANTYHNTLGRNTPKLIAMAASDSALELFESPYPEPYHFFALDVVPEDPVYALSEKSVGDLQAEDLKFQKCRCPSSSDATDCLLAESARRLLTDDPDSKSSRSRAEVFPPTSGTRDSLLRFVGLAERSMKTCSETAKPLRQDIITSTVPKDQDPGTIRFAGLSNKLASPLHRFPIYDPDKGTCLVRPLRLWGAAWTKPGNARNGVVASIDPDVCSVLRYIGSSVSPQLTVNCDNARFDESIECGEKKIRVAHLDRK